MTFHTFAAGALISTSQYLLPRRPMRACDCGPATEAAIIPMPDRPFAAVSSFLPSSRFPLLAPLGCPNLHSRLSKASRILELGWRAGKGHGPLASGVSRPYIMEGGAKSRQRAGAALRARAGPYYGPDSGVRRDGSSHGVMGCKAHDRPSGRSDFDLRGSDAH